MKKILFFIAMLLPVAAFADNVSADRAKNYATKFLGNGTRANVAAVRQVSDSEKMVAGQKVDFPAYYIFNSDGGGFVIISGEDAVSPVLAYSYTGSFKTEGMPDNLAYWMGQLRAEIIKVRESKAKATPEVKAEWDALAATGVTPSYYSDEFKLETAQWDQGTPYNNLCPTEGSSKTPSGCVATATSIVMRYHKWPEAGHGTLPDYKYLDGTGSHKGHALGHTYDWDNMPMQYKSGKYTEEQAAQVAQLLLDVGVMTRMMYHSGGSGTLTQLVAPALEKYMYYDPSVRYERKGFYSDAQWFDKIKTELNEVGPIVYDGQSSGSGGHAFVIDGYDKSGNLSVNWGWGGSSNGYFSISNMGGFSTDCGAIFNMKPTEGGQPAQAAVSYTDIYVDEGTVIQPGRQFKTYVTHIVPAYRDTKVDLAIGLFNAAGEIKDIVSEIGTIQISLEYYRSEVSFDECKITGKLESGDYLKMVYRHDETEPFTPALFDRSEGGRETVSLDIPVINLTSFEYDASERIVILTANYGGSVSFSLVNRQGEAVKNGVKTSGNSFIIDKSVVPSGQYTVSITADWTTQSFTFTL